MTKKKKKASNCCNRLIDQWSIKVSMRSRQRLKVCGMRLLYQHRGIIYINRARCKIIHLEETSSFFDCVTMRHNSTPCVILYPPCPGGNDACRLPACTVTVLRAHHLWRESSCYQPTLSTSQLMFHAFFISETMLMMCRREQSRVRTVRKAE